jgi:hypothetical protein
VSRMKLPPSPPAEKATARPGRSPRGCHGGLTRVGNAREHCAGQLRSVVSENIGGAMGRVASRGEKSNEHKAVVAALCPTSTTASASALDVLSISGVPALPVSTDIKVLYCFHQNNSSVIQKIAIRARSIINLRLFRRGWDSRVAQENLKIR